MRARDGLWEALRWDILSGTSSRPLSVAMIATRCMRDHDPKDRDLMDVEEVVVGLMFRGNLRRSPRRRRSIFDLKISGCSSSSLSLISIGVCKCEAL